MKINKIVTVLSIITAVLIISGINFYMNSSPPVNLLESKVQTIDTSALNMKNINLETKKENTNKENEITEREKKNGTKSEEEEEQKEEPSTQPSEEENYKDLEEDAYAESSLEIDNLLEEIGIKDKSQIIYAKCITGAGKETLLSAINGAYSLYLSTQGTTIIQIKYKDHSGQVQTYVKKITYKRPEGSTPDAKQPIINTNVKDNAIYTNSTLNFDIWVTNYRGKPLAYNNMEVTVNGSEASYVGEMDRQTYRTTLKTGANTIKIKVTDTYQYTVTRTFTVYYKSGKGKITISLEGGTVGKKYFVAPETMEIESGVSLASALVEFLDDNGYGYEYAGSLNDGFYLSKIKKHNMLKGYKIPSSLVKKIEEDGLIFDKEGYESLNSLGEFDFCQGSGWMYSINQVYASYGLDKAYVQDGDVVRIRFTLAYGKDIGGYSVTGGTYGTLKNYGKEW